MHLIAVKKHRSNYPNPIRFKKGEGLIIGQKESEYNGWLWVIASNGNQGWAPVQYLELDTGHKAVAKQDYSAHELHTEIGDRLRLQYELNGWGWVENEAGVYGWIPMDTTLAVTSKTGDQLRTGNAKREI